MAKLINISPLTDPVGEVKGLDLPVPDYDQETYRVWASDNQVYGPIPLPTLVQWVQEARVFRDTWVYLEASQEWRPANKIDPLRDYFPPGTETLFIQRESAEGSIV